MKIGSLVTDAKLENEGREFSVGDGGFVTVARSGRGNKAYKRLYRKLIRPYRQQVRDETLDDATADAIHVEVMAHTILLGWRGIADFDGSYPIYSVEKAIEWLTKVPEFKARVQAFADEMRNFQSANLEEDEETLGNGSSGTSTGDPNSEKTPLAIA